eukprot:TRINITY_DN64280_c0_g1_i1.p1 TRINITY_DN64280_c0_g1~~TRINITY_DN64280_c0_g1_i1.p1  ORF type:complete len:886 (+),score=137.04 TRINITY_DN64280_c0_g1_i1:57-2714(+)
MGRFGYVKEPYRPLLPKIGIAASLRYDMPGLLEELSGGGAKPEITLRKLQKWVHELKGRDMTEWAMRRFVSAGGVQAVAKAMQSAPSDTTVANRSLEILAGESSSQWSLPLLHDHEAMKLMCDIEFYAIALNALKLYDLQAVTRGLACKILHRFCHYPESRTAILEAQGISVVFTQIPKVRNAYAFMALAALTESSDGKQELRSLRSDGNAADEDGAESVSDEALLTLLSRYAEHPEAYSSQSESAAAGLLLSVYSWDELDDVLSENDDFSEIRRLLLDAKQSMYMSWFSIMLGYVLPVVGLASHLSTTYYFFVEGKMEMFYLACLGFALSTALSTRSFIHLDNYTQKDLGSPGVGLDVALNIITLGTYTTILICRRCARIGFKTSEYYGFKLFQSVIDVLFLFLAANALLLSGYAQGFPRIQGFALFTRQASAGLSLISLSMTCTDLVKNDTRHGQRQFGKTYLEHVEDTYFGTWLFLYQGSELCAMVSMIVLHVALWPVGNSSEVLPFLYEVPMFCVLGIHAALLCLAVGFTTSHLPKVGHLVWIPFCLFCNVIGGPSADLRAMSVINALWRHMDLVASWLLVWREVHNKPDLEHHFTTNACLIALFVAFAGTIVHAICFTQQWLAGRWRFDHGEESTPGLAGILDRKHSAKKIQGSFVSLSHLPKLTATRWKSVHAFLPTMTARVDLDTFARYVQTSSADDYSGIDGNFVVALFQVGVGLMLPKVKADVGKHCFAYITLLLDEYSRDERGKARDQLGLLHPSSMGFFDPLQGLRAELQHDWRLVSSGGPQINFDGFRMVLVSRHAAKLGQEETSPATLAFDEFLRRLFFVCQLLGHGSCDRHSFFYCGLIAYEFYFADAVDNDPDAGCGSSTPVADNLGLTA